ncbi:hypothetical protein RIF25_14445 [Thermosynechococcaceae cyanobacterium BACA0444]|uniref:Uncharacterized protein n=1 Tax=Pseudocalidococcus azoricus BACA0444 TaxID=2918990 RepID=A0AAE4FVC4_9CYAN|nr:hypothetical protein [Pseudocalidococcus azoricus]MDS3861999.1 hypothetical protein [Pseudocalidococcus azoricus BACA0444]
MGKLAVLPTLLSILAQAWINFQPDQDRNKPPPATRVDLPLF